MLFKACLLEVCSDQASSSIFVFGEASVSVQWIEAVTSDGAASSWWGNFISQLETNQPDIELQANLVGLFDAELFE
jgi:hypothetical protein